MLSRIARPACTRLIMRFWECEVSDFASAAALPPPASHLCSPYSENVSGRSPVGDLPAGAVSLTCAYSRRDLCGRRFPSGFALAAGPRALPPCREAIWGNVSSLSTSSTMAAFRAGVWRLRIVVGVYLSHAHFCV